MNDEKQAAAAEALREARALIHHLAPNPPSWGSDVDRKAAVTAKIDAALSAASAPADGLGPLPALPAARVLASGTIGGKRVELKGWHEEDLQAWAKRHGFVLGAAPGCVGEALL